jgi:hypothetical protein
MRCIVGPRPELTYDTDFPSKTKRRISYQSSMRLVQLLSEYMQREALGKRSNAVINLTSIIYFNLQC